MGSGVPECCVHCRAARSAATAAPDHMATASLVAAFVGFSFRDGFASFSFWGNT